MISHDEGQTWEDEVYYLDTSEPSGYNQSLVLEDDTILTISSRNDNEITAIRWKPLKKKEEIQSSVSQVDRSDAAKQARIEAVHRQRRVIYNDDMYELDRKWANTAEGFLKGRLKPLVGTHVDTISFSVIEADAPVYDSKVQPIYGDAHAGPPPYWPNITDNIKALAKAGQCPIQIITDFAHDNGMESWAHVRMNDVHDSFLPGWLSTWKKEHPELLVDSTEVIRDMEKYPMALYVTSLDFTHEVVRQRKLEIIEEVCQRYDIDGFELDYIRHPVLFNRTMRGLPVTAEEVQIMTSLHRRIRRLTDEAAARRGRPILLTVRVPDTFEQSMNIGLDVKAWLNEDLVDILIAGGGYAPFTMPVDEIIKWPVSTTYRSIRASTRA